MRLALIPSSRNKRKLCLPCSPPPNRVQRLTGALKKYLLSINMHIFTSFKSILISFVTSVKVTHHNNLKQKVPVHLLISFMASVKYIWNDLQSKASEYIPPVLHEKRVCLSSCMFIYTHGNYDLNVGTVLKHSHISRVKNPKHLHSVIYCTQVMYIV